MKYKYALVFLFILFSISSVQGLNITSEVGSSYIRWDWEIPPNATYLYKCVDGNDCEFCYANITTLTLYNLNPRENHSIVIRYYDEDVLIDEGYNNTRTFYPIALLYYLSLFNIFLCILMVMYEPKKLGMIIIYSLFALFNIFALDMSIRLHSGLFIGSSLIFSFLFIFYGVLLTFYHYINKEGY